MSPVKVHDLFAHRQDLTRAQFFAYWRSTHAELATTFKQIKHYTQSHREGDQDLIPGFGETWPDGCAETWYDDASEVEAMVAEPRFAAELMEDEKNFMNLENPRPLLVSELALLEEDGFDPGDRGIKLLIFAARPAESSREEFLAAWTGEEDAELGRRVGATRHALYTPVTAGGVLIQTDLEDDSQQDGGGSYDAVRELWWPDRAALAAATAEDDEAWKRLLRKDALDPARSITLVARENVVLP
jgi:hypothetical protein